MPTCQQRELSSAVCREECSRDTAAERIPRPILFAVFKPLAAFRTKIHTSSRRAQSQQRNRQAITSQRPGPWIFQTFPTCSLSSEGFPLCEQSHASCGTNGRLMDHSHGGRSWSCLKSTGLRQVRIAATQKATQPMQRRIQTRSLSSSRLKASSRKRSSSSSKSAGHCWSGFTSYPSDWRCTPCSGNNFSAEVVSPGRPKKVHAQKILRGDLAG